MQSDDYIYGLPLSETQPAWQAPPALKTQVHRFVFTGSSDEYFRIWIVNVFLTIVTFGIYAAWAKVRTRQYFYANTQLAGHGFEYLGQPIPILKGNLIVGALFLMYSLVTQFAPLWAGLAGLVLAVSFPYLIFQSMRFLALNSAYRNIRFRFHGTLMDSYVHYALLPLLTVPTLGLAFPYVAFRQRQWVLGNAAFGMLKNRFQGTSGSFYRIYASALGIGVLVAIPVSMITRGLLLSRPSTVSLGGGLPDLLSVIVGVYISIIFASVFLQQFVYARTVNYTLNQSQASDFMRFSSTLRARDVMWIRFSNLVAIVFSLGLLSAWAKVRYVKYLLDHVTVITKGDLDGIAADLSQQQQSALGDAATDFFNVDVGL
jgi:uncharacterized membrane protein YjgN (DUF898 family)